ncbi:sulfatase-like hydrolase/transferase [Halomarina halobia]|uniref:Sulfatase-like hydrolase/transferase n=1 Tax=Halomarina halobia TaxID=3033386 RepID=A0ABD6A7I5_9EURY|nr:sulfatase-like hydrolase/transferase [Halomarina sp. PSR21]
MDTHAVTLLVTVDSLRADALAAMPTVSALAREGAHFTRAYAHGNWTPFSFPSVLGSDHVFAEGSRLGPSSRPTLAERLRAGGVRTVGLNAANGFLSEHWGYDRGFDAFETWLDGSGIDRLLAAHPTVGGWLQLVAAPGRRAFGIARGEGEHPAVDTSNLRALERRAVESVREADRPLFLWVHYMDTHTPYVPAPRHVRAVGGATGTASMLRAHLRAGLGREVGDRALADLRTCYDGAAHQVDASVGRLLDALSAAGLRDETCVIVAGDHGEEFMDHGHLAHYPKLYSELINVPLVVDAPDAPARTVTAPVGLRSIPPTVCAAMGVAAPDLDAGSLLPVVRDGERPAPEPVLSVAVRGERVTQQPIPRRPEDGELLASARTDRFTYIYHTRSGRRELYDRSADPDERRDVSGTADHAPTVRRLHRAVERHVARLDAADDGRKSADETPAAIERRLDALGYR